MSYAGSTWYAPITQDSSLVPADVANFALLITEANAPAGFLDSLSANPAQSGGGDLLVYLQPPVLGVEPATRYPIEVVDLTLAAGAGGTCQIWVGLPNLDSAVDGVVYLVWGDAAASQPARGALYGSESVWPADYAGRWHLESITGGAPEVNDSTSNLRHGTVVGNVGAIVPAIIGDGIDFPGSGTVQMANISLTSSVFTFGVWAESVFAAGNRPLLGQFNTSNGFLARVSTAGQGIYQGIIRQSDLTYKVASSATTPDGMHRVVVIADGSNLGVYIDGALSSPLVPYDGTVNPTVEPLIMAGYPTLPYSGVMDEAFFRFSADAGGEIAHYRNESNPGTFSSAGAVQQLAAPTSAARPQLYYWYN